MKIKYFLGFVVSLAFVAGVGCGSASTDETTEFSEAEGALTVTKGTTLKTASWDHVPSANLSCSGDGGAQSYSGKIKAGHKRLYASFPGAAGQTATFTLRATWTAKAGAVVAVTDGAFKVLAAGSTSSGKTVSTSVTFPSDGKYFVFFAPNTSGHAAAGNTVTVEAACSANKLCGERTVNGIVEAKNFASRTEADAWVAVPNTTSSNVFESSCDDVMTKCPAIYMPQCGISGSGEFTNYGSDCVFRAAVRAEAGPVGEARGAYAKGVCSDGSSLSCATYTISGATTYYVRNVGSEAEGIAWSLLQPSAESTVIYSGACNTPTICTLQYNPVCGTVRSEAPNSYGNVCAFYGAVRSDAGGKFNGSSKGYYAPGVCPSAAN
jgi:hypothetical protein